jgi:hypothetical protein
MKDPKNYVYSTLIFATLMALAFAVMAFDRWLWSADALEHMCSCTGKEDCYPVEYRMHDGRVARGINYDDGKSCLIIERRDQ